MKLRFKKGAVVRFELVSSGYPIYKVGKVQEVFEDKVVLIEQISVEKQSTNNNEFDYMNSRYDLTKTRNGKTMHINRALIASWEYANRNTASMSILLDNTGNNATFTYYDKDGYCYGDGTDFSKIPDNPSNYILVPSSSDDNSEGLDL